MTLREANRLMAQTDCNDTQAAAAALTERARAIVEFAAVAPRDLLVETYKVGEEFRARLELARNDARVELDRATKLSRGLESTLDRHQAFHVVACFG
ncbi:MAG TPA: hypothetical protein VGL53_20230 [Bryobacteraceae bacterium]|jgi:hypothetical protein